MVDKDGRQSFFGSLDASALGASPIGMLTWRVTDLGLAELSFGTRHGPMKAPSHPLADRVYAQLRSYFAGELKVFDLPLALGGTLFQSGCWEVLQTIEYAQTISYAEQARQLGRPTATRAVANANGANPIPIIIPCHRVIASDGSLGGYGPGVDKKQWLLTHEFENA